MGEKCVHVLAVKNKEFDGEYIDSVYESLEDAEQAAKARNLTGYFVFSEPVIPARKRHKLWLNLYPEDEDHLSIYVHRTKDSADKAARKDRTACLPIVYRDGDGIVGRVSSGGSEDE